MSDLIEAVRRHADYESNAEARTATEAVLDALGERIARGEAEDLAAHLAGDPADWVVPEDSERPTSLAPDEFVAYVADNADVDRERAWDYAESVLGGLSDVVPDAEFQGVTTQLPPEYDRLLVEA